MNFVSINYNKITKLQKQNYRPFLTDLKALS